MGMIGGAAMALMSFFGSKKQKGPSTTEIILKSIQRLSKQISNLHKAMETNFREVLNLQVQTMHIIQEGFQELSIQLDQQIGGVRAEVLSSISDIRDAIIAIARYQHLANTELFKADKRKAFSEADRLVRGQYDNESGDDFNTRLQGVIGLLYHWISKESSNSLLNYSIFFETKDFPIVLLMRHFGGGPGTPFCDEGFNACLGYLVDYAKSITKQESPAIPNPLIWAQSVEKYLMLKQFFPRLDADKENEELDRIITQGDGILKYLNELGKNEAFWNGLLAEYYKLLNDIRGSITQFAETFSQNEKVELDRKYAELPMSSEQNSAGLNLNLLDEPPATLINQFNDRSIQSVGKEIGVEKEGDLKAQLGDKKLDTQPLQTILKGKVPATLLAAEYLGRLSFTATEDTNSPVSMRRNYNNHLCLDHTGAVNGREVFDQVSAILKRPAPIITRETITGSRSDCFHTEIDLKAELLGVQSNNWQLPISLTLDDGQQSIPLTIQGCSWDKMPFVKIHFVSKLDWTNTRAWCYEFFGRYMRVIEHPERSTSYEPDYKYSLGGTTRRTSEMSVPLHLCMPRPEVENRYCSHLVGFIKDQWQSKKAVTLAEPKGRLISAAREAKIGGLVQGYYLQKRQEMVNVLLDGRARGTEVGYRDEFKKSLNELNKHVRLIQCYIYLFGKEIGNSPFNELLTQEKIHSDLNSYRSRRNIAAALVPCLVESKPRLNAQTFFQLPKQQPNPMHPINLLLTAKIWLISHKSEKNIRLELYPDLMRYIDLNRYYFNQLIARNEVFKNHVYNFLDAIYSEKFLESKMNLADGDYFLGSGIRVAELTIRENYNRDYRRILQWAIRNSLTSPFETHFNPNSPNNILVPTGTIVGNDDLRTTLRELIQFGWKNNINLLKNLAIQQGVKLSQEEKLPCPTMWQDGVCSLLKIIYNERLNKIASHPNIDNSPKVRASDLKVCFYLGRDLKRFFYKLGLSKEFFGELFVIYVGTLEELRIFVEDEHNTKNRKNRRLFSELQDPETASPDNRGTIKKLFDKIETCASLLSSYIKMVFGYDFQDNSRFKNLTIYALNKQDLLKFLEKTKEEKPDEQTLNEKIIQYITEIIDPFKDYILYRIAEEKELIMFQYYLETYFRQNEGTDTFKIDGAKYPNIFKTGLNVRKLDMFNQFLQIHQDRIVAIELHQIKIVASQLKLLVQIFKDNPYLKKLSLSCTELDSELIYLLNPILSQLTALDLSGNNIGAIDNYEEWLNFTRFLKAATRLTELNLAANGLTAEALCPIVAACEYMPQLQEIDLSGNPHLIGNQVEFFALFLRQHPKLQRVLIANTGVTSTGLALLQDKSKDDFEKLRLAETVELDISDNQIFSSQPESIYNVIYFLNMFPSLTKLIILNIISQADSQEQLTAILWERFPNLEEIVMDADSKTAQENCLSESRPSIKLQTIDDSSRTTALQKSFYSSATFMANRKKAGNSYLLSLIANPGSIEEKETSKQQIALASPEEIHKEAKALMDGSSIFKSRLSVKLYLGQPWLDNILAFLEQTIYLLEQDIFVSERNSAKLIANLSNNPNRFLAAGERKMPAVRSGQSPVIEEVDKKSGVQHSLGRIQ